MLGEALMTNGIKVKVADTRRAGLQDARMKGMSTFYGNPLSEHADRYMDLTGYNCLMAVSRNPEANAMVAARYRHDFGPKHVFSVQASSTDEADQAQWIIQGQIKARSNESSCFASEFFCRFSQPSYINPLDKRFLFYLIIWSCL